MVESTTPQELSSPSLEQTSTATDVGGGGGGDRNIIEERSRRKDFARESRLSFRNQAERQLRQHLKDEAMEICHFPLQNFAQCAKESGFWVAFSCRTHLKALNQCLSTHNGEEAWQKYKEAHKDELDRKARGGIR